MMLARVVTNVRANFCLKFIQNTENQRRREKRVKEVLGVLLGLYTLNKKFSVSQFFFFFSFSFVRHKREKREDKTREDVETTRDDDDGVEVHKRSEDVDDHHKHKHHRF